MFYSNYLAESEFCNGLRYVSKIFYGGIYSTIGAAGAYSFFPPFYGLSAFYGFGYFANKYMFLKYLLLCLPKVKMPLIIIKVYNFIFYATYNYHFILNTQVYYDK